MTVHSIQMYRIGHSRSITRVWVEQFQPPSESYRKEVRTTENTIYIGSMILSVKVQPLLS